MLLQTILSEIMCVKWLKQNFTHKIKQIFVCVEVRDTLYIQNIINIYMY